MDKITLKKTDGENNFSFWESFLLPVLRYRRMTYAIVTGAVMVTLVYCLLINNRYTSTATILPSSGTDQLSDLKDIAAGSLGELGLGAMMQVPDNSSALYPKVLTSRLIAEKILKKRYNFTFDDEAMSMTMQEYVDIDNLDLALRRLNQLVQVDLDRRTGLITLAVTTEYPELSAAVTHAYLEELDDYNVNYRQSKARDNERFVATRLVQVENDLHTAETSLREFRDQNRNYTISNDPGLREELQQLERDVAVREGVYLALTKKYELAKVEAVKDVPIVQVLDRGSVPLVKTSPRRSIYLAGALFGSLFFSIILSLWLVLAAKRRLKANFEKIVTSPDINMSRLEASLVKRARGLADRFEQAGWGR